MSRITKTLVHVGWAFCAYLVAYQIVLGHDATWWASNAGAAVVAFAAGYGLLAAVAELALQTERASWRYVSIPDVFGLARVAGLTACVFLVVTFLFLRAHGVPRSSLMLTWLLHFGGLIGLRLLRRLTWEKSLVRAVAPMLHRASVGARPILLIGDVGAADSFLRELGRDAAPAYAPLGLLALDDSHKGGVIRGVPVLGMVSDLESRADLLRASPTGLDGVLFLSPPDVVQDIDPEVLGRLKGAGLTLLRLPAMSELSAAQPTLPSALRELSVEELLARPAVKLDLARIHELVNGKRVLVTGAGGSIGSEICRQVAAFGCDHLALLDHSEFGLFKIDQEIGVAHPSLACDELICDVRDRSRVDACIRETAPDIVFHAAALKHVPIVERHAAEGALTNVLGTWNVADAARKAGVGQMVMISTDKAVDPSNIMGATKRLAESVVRGLHGRSRTVFSVVRFGNVLGSAGSVVPTFAAQIERGGPVTITHPDVERYFMTIPEAVQLVLFASAESASRAMSQPSVFVLEMGQPVKIIDLARNMIQLHGLTVGKDIDIAFTGLRPGEKLSEDLVDTNERELSRLGSVIEVIDALHAPPLAEMQVKALEKLARAGDDDALRQAVSDHVRRLRTAEPVERLAV